MTNNILHIEQVKKALQAVKSKNALNFYFVACGGSMATLQSVQYIFDRETAVPSFIYNAKEFICRNPKGLGKDSVVVLCSHSGKTPETVEAALFAKKNGALTLSISSDMNSPLSKSAEYMIHYDWGDHAIASEGLNGMLYRVLFGILNIINQSDKYERAIAAVDKLQICIDTSKEKFSKAALTFGDEYRRESLIYTMASGESYPEAYALTACFLMEMQWIHSNCIHSGEFFHGPFEVTDYDVPFMLIKSIGDGRVMDERAHDFLKKKSKKITVIDIAEFNMDGIDDDLKAYFSQAVLTVIVKLYIEALAESRGHMMAVRRYMHKMEY